MARDSRGAVNMERFDGFQTPGLTLLPLRLGPTDGLPVGRQDQASPRVGDFDAVPSGFVDIQEKRLLDRVFVRTSLNLDSVFEKNIGGQQNFLAAVDRIRYVMESALGAGRVLGVSEIV